MIEESKYCRDVIKKHFNKELVMANADNEDFKNSECWTCDNVLVDNNVKIKIIVISLKNKETLHIEIVISVLN